MTKHFPKKNSKRLCFKKSDYGLEAYVEHHSGDKVVHVTTADPEIRQYLNKLEFLDTLFIKIKI